VQRYCRRGRISETTDRANTVCAPLVRWRRGYLGVMYHIAADPHFPVPAHDEMRRVPVPVADPAGAPRSRAGSVCADITLADPTLVIRHQPLDPGRDLVYRGYHSKGGQPPLCEAPLTGRQTVARGASLISGHNSHRRMALPFATQRQVPPKRHLLRDNPPRSPSSTVGRYTMAFARAVCIGVARCHSTLIASQLPIDRWHSVMPDPTVADAVLDRLVHGAHRIELRGESMRRLHATKPTGDGETVAT